MCNFVHGHIKDEVVPEEVWLHSADSHHHVSQHLKHTEKGRQTLMICL